MSMQSVKNVSERVPSGLLSTGFVSLRDSTSRAVAAACMLAASPASLALAQTAQSTDLEPLVVEAQKKKKKSASSSNAAPVKKKAQAAPTPPQYSPQPQAPVVNSADGASRPGGNPYANPDAPYEVQRSASGKLTEPLVDTPRTVTAIPKDVIQDKKVRDLRDLARETPGLTIGSAEGGNSYSAFAIRGFKANNDIFVDGIRNPGNISPDVFSIEQVEIYKGPSGSIAGRSTIGGAINFITKQPDLNFSNYETATTIGTDNSVRTTVDINQVISRDFAVRANVMYDQHDVAGRDFADSERWGGLFSATAKPTSDLKVTLDYYRYRNNATPDWGVPILRSPLASAPGIGTHVPVTEFGVPRDTWYGQANLDFMREKADVGTATVVAKLTDGVTLTNKTRVGQTGVDYVATSAEGNTYRHPQRDQVADLYANQTELNAKFRTGFLKHDMVAGVELSRERIDRDGYRVLENPPLNSGGTAGIIPNFPFTDPHRNSASIAFKGNVYNATVDTVGTYLMDTIRLSDQWIVNGGIRVDQFQRDQVGFAGVGTPAQQATAAAANTANVKDTLLSWNVGVVYKPISIASVYAAYGTTESPVGSELDSTGAEYNGLSATLVDVPPQQASSIEIGTKWELFDRRLLATAALFQTDVNHARTNLGATSPSPADDANAFNGKYRIRGIELGAAGNITNAWSVYGGLTILDTEVLRSSPNAPQEVGRRLANIPLMQFSLLSKYQLTDQLSVGGQATYGGKVYGGHLAANDAMNHTVDWWRFDAFTEYEINKHWEIRLSGLNLTNELYYDALYQAQDNPPGGTFAYVAPGRAGYLTVRYKY